MSKTHTIQDPKTFTNLEALPALYATDGTKGDRPAVKLFDAAGQAFWVIWEYNAETKEGFGYADLGLGFPELGYINVAEIETLGIRIEQDIWVDTMVEAIESRQAEVPSYLLG